MIALWAAMQINRNGNLLPLPCQAHVAVARRMAPGRRPPCDPAGRTSSSGTTASQGPGVHKGRLPIAGWPLGIASGASQSTGG